MYREKGWTGLERTLALVRMDTYDSDLSGQEHHSCRICLEFLAIRCWRFKLSAFYTWFWEGISRRELLRLCIYLCNGLES